MRDIAIYGAGGFGREVACLIRRINESSPQKEWNLIGFFDDGLAAGSSTEYGKVIGGIDVLNQWQSPLCIVIAIGTPSIVKKIAERIINPKIDYPNLIDPTVVFFDKDNVTLGKGNIICFYCSISCNVSIGNFNIFNGQIPIGHDTMIGNYNVVMPTSNISGGVIIGDCNFFGVKSVVLQYLKIGNNTRIGACSVVMRKTKDGYLYMGNPAIRVNF